MTTTDDLIEAADDCLRRFGLSCVGLSSKSRSSYWSLTNDEGQPRIRLSDHAVVYASSDTAVTIGFAPDDDCRLDKDESVDDVCRRAVRMLVEAQAEHDREVYTGGYDRDEAPEDHADADASEADLRTKWAAFL